MSRIEHPTAVDLVLHRVAMRFASFFSGAPERSSLQMKQREAKGSQGKLDNTSRLNNPRPRQCCPRGTSNVRFHSATENVRCTSSIMFHTAATNNVYRACSNMFHAAARDDVRRSRRSSNISRAAAFKNIRRISSNMCHTAASENVSRASSNKQPRRTSSNMCHTTARTFVALAAMELFCRIAFQAMLQWRKPVTAGSKVNFTNEPLGWSQVGSWKPALRASQPNLSLRVVAIVWSHLNVACLFHCKPRKKHENTLGMSHVAHYCWPNCGASLAAVAARSSDLSKLFDSWSRRMKRANRPKPHAQSQASHSAGRRGKLPAGRF